jgi:hypothetical protein
MKTRLFLTVCTAAGLALSAGPAMTQSAYEAPRTAFGTPDLQGVWTNVTVTPLERRATYGDRLVHTPQEVAELEGRAIENVNYENLPTDPSVGAEDHTRKNCDGPGGRDCGYNAGWKDSTVSVMRVGGEPRTSFIYSTPDGRIPPQVERQISAAEAARDQAERDNLAGETGTRNTAGRNDNPETRSLAERCIAFGNSAGPLLPNGYYNNNIKIVQGEDNVAIWLEMVHEVRNVRIGGEHRTDGVRPWFGDSIGWWEGDTLVVETINYHPDTSFRGSSENLKLTERFTRVGPNSLHYNFTVEDPTIWAEPWSGEYEFYPSAGIYEYACHEGNYGLESILAGARYEEQEAAAAAGGAG